MVHLLSDLPRVVCQLNTDTIYGEKYVHVVVCLSENGELKKPTEKSSFIPVANRELELEVFVFSFALITLSTGTPQNGVGRGSTSCIFIYY